MKILLFIDSMVLYSNFIFGEVINTTQSHIWGRTSGDKKLQVKEMKPSLKALLV